MRTYRAERELSVGILVIRTIFLYICIVFAIRVMGKRQLGELQPSELVVTLLISNIATLSIEDTDVPLLGSILPIFTLVSCEVLVSYLILKSNTMRKIISGNPRILIRNGQIDQKEMRNLRWSIDDLNEQLRVNGIFDIAEVDYAIVETSGSLSAFQKFGNRPVTAEMMGVAADGEPDAPPVTVISDGELVKDSLNFCNLKVEWLESVLHDKQVEIKDVFLMTCDRRARYTLILKEKRKNA